MSLARCTASLTQSRTASSLVWHMRQMSPVATSCSNTTSSESLATTLTTPSAEIWKVLSCEPYSSAFFAMRPTFATLPMEDTSNLPLALQSSMQVWNTLA